MKLTDLVKFFRDNNEIAIFHILDNQNYLLLEQFNQTADNIFILYKDLEIESFEVNHESKDEKNQYHINVIIDIYEETAYELQYHSLHDNCMKTAYLSYDYINTMRDAYENCCFTKVDFESFVKSVFTYND